MAAINLQDVQMSDGVTVRAAILNLEDKNKPLLLTCHGAPGLSNHSETAQSYSFLADTFRVLVSDLRGCGSSSKAGPLTHKQWIQDLDELRAWAGAETVVLIGASHGGFLALDYAVAHPGRLQALLIGDTAAHMAGWGLLEAYKTAMTDPRSKEGVDPEQLVRLFSGRVRDLQDLATGFGSIASLYAVPLELKGEAEVDVDEVLGKTLTPVLETLNAAMGECLSRYDVRDRLAELRVPVFIWVGRYDWITPVAHSEYLKEHIKGAELIVYEKSGHMAALEEKTKFQRDVREFLKKSGIPET